MKKRELNFILATVIILLLFIVFFSNCTVKVVSKTQYAIKDTVITHQRIDNSSGINEVLPSRKN